MHAQAITSFQPEPFWAVRPRAVKSGQSLDLEWERGRVFDQHAGAMYAAMVRRAAHAGRACIQCVR